MNELITLNHFKKALVSQPFFIWHTLDSEAEDFEMDDNELGQLIWNETVIEENKSDSFAQRFARTFRFIDDAIVEVLKKNHDVIILTGSIEDRLVKTQELINSGKLLISPAFKFENIISSPFAFDTQTKVIIEKRYSSKYSLKDYIMFIFDYYVISKTTTIKDCQLFFPLHDYGKKGEIPITSSTVGAITKTAKSIHDDISFFEVAKDSSDDYSMVGALQKHSAKNLKAEDWPATVKDIIEKINNSKDEEKILANKLSQDLTFWGANKDWKELLIRIDNQYAKLSGTLIKKSSILANESPWETTFGIALQRAMKENKYQVFGNLLEYKKIKEAKKAIWYDFEGFSLPVIALDFTYPYQQIVFQVSIIETDKGKEISNKNIVLDPLKLNHLDFLKIIDAIYREDCDCYVVYNKSYEITRLKEMVWILEMQNHPQANEYKEKFETIKSKTVDLYDEFRYGSSNKLPKILLPDQNGFTSIKNVEKHINENNITLPRPITPYKELVVKNGATAMEKGIDRALGITGDNKWSEEEKDLAKYCENDVRAMIMVYDFITMIESENVK